MRQRTVLQHLSLIDWGQVNRLPISAGKLIVVESRCDARMRIQTNSPGLSAMRPRI